MTSGSPWIEIIEASYRVELDEAPWLENVLAAAAPALERGLGSWAMSYDLGGSGPLRLRTPVVRNLPPGGSLASILEAQANVPASAVAQTFQTTTCGTASQLLGATYGRQTSLERFREFGLGDTLGINVRDTTEGGCLLAGFLPEPSALTPREIEVWKKIASHIAAGFRLQRARGRGGATGTDEAEAVLAPSGKLEYAEPAAQGADARDQLREAVRAIEAAKGSLRHRAPEEAVDRWKTLVAARWTLLEHIDVDGRRYLVARENAPIDPTPAALTFRERQVVRHAALGHHNKLIAYELGITASTVRVLIARAAAKLGTSSREDTIRVFVAMARALARSGDGDGA
jgi:DNA-binding CsgD family transcriptional regulator